MTIVFNTSMNRKEYRFSDWRAAKKFQAQRSEETGLIRCKTDPSTFTVYVK